MLLQNWHFVGQKTPLHMNVFAVLAIFISYWQCSKAMKVQTPQFPRDPYNYSSDCWSMKKVIWQHGQLGFLCLILSSRWLPSPVCSVYWTNTLFAICQGRCLFNSVPSAFFPRLREVILFTVIFFLFTTPLHRHPRCRKEEGQWLLWKLLIQFMKSDSMC